MIETVDYQGRLQRSDGKTIASGTYTLRFRLQPFNRDDVLWEEEIPNVTVATGGAYRALLGHRKPIPASIFEGGQRVVIVHALKNGKRIEEIAERSPFTGALVKVGAQMDAIEERLAAIEKHPALSGDGQMDRLRRRLRRTMKAVKQVMGTGGPPVVELGTQVGILEERVTRLDGEEGRVIRLEDELEDLTGPDGDVVDLGERLEGLEARMGSGPVLGRAGGGLTAVAQERLDAMARRLELLEQRLASIPKDGLSAESLGAVKKTGDTLSGELVIAKGGLHVQAGLLKGKAGELTSLDVTGQLRVAKLVTASLDLRGDLTVDNPTRTVQVRMVEGRAVAGRQGGPLYLNGRDGGEVAIGRADIRAGLDVHGSVRADRLDAATTGYAEAFAGEAAPGELVALVGPQRRVSRSRGRADPGVIGVATVDAAVSVGAGLRVIVAGTARCLAVGPIRVGDRLVASSSPGRAARREPGEEAADFGRALADLDGEGEILVLVG